MELLQLRHFCDAAKTENFSTTAKRFSVPPSAVSQSIRRLETELGARLFTRRANTVSLNATGEEFYKKASAALSLLAEAADAVTSHKHGRVNICINVSRRRILRVIEKFQFLHPNAELNIKHLADPMHKEFDLVIAGEDDRLTDFRRELLATEPLAIAIHKSHPLAAEENLSVSMLKNEPFILMNEQSSMHTIALSVCAEFGFRPRIALQSDDPNYLIRLVNLGMGVAIVPIVPTSVWENAFSDEVRRYPIESYARNTFVYIPKAKRLTHYTEAFIEMLMKEY